ncbi:MAG: serine/threonine protein phosphatase 1 [Pseudoalteromonas tetraodonis]|jgi:serine/threonine protein phosphatase 1
MRTLAIGDIHGCRGSLESLAEFAEFSADDTIVTLGDYVDRGPDSKGVIDFLNELDKRCHLVRLKGNHEIMMVEARDSREVLTSWLGVGGDETLDSYGASLLKGVPQSHWDFIESGRAFYENDSHFFVHANAYSDVPLKQQPDSMLYWEFFGFPEPHESGKIMVCGHSSQKNGLPKNIGHAICIDTNACRGGWLTCLDTESGIYWQTNEAGERRKDVISGRRED